MLLLLKYKRSIKSAKRLLLEFEVSSDSLLLRECETFSVNNVLEGLLW